MSYCFKDEVGREWNCTLTFGNMKRLKARTGLDLVNCDKPREGAKNEQLALMTELYLDIDLFLDTLYCLVVPLNEQNQPAVTKAEFEDAFSGATFEAAHNAFFASLKDFFRSTHREVLAEGIDHQKELVKACAEQGRKQLQKLDLLSRVNSEAEKFFGEQFSKLQESLELTPTA